MAFKWQVPPEWQERVREVGKTLRRADSVLNTLKNVRTAEGPLSAALGVASVAGQVLELVSEERSPHDYLVALGYVCLPTELGEFFCDRLYRTDAPRREVAQGSTTRIVLWESGVAAVYTDNGVERRFDEGPFALPGTDLAAVFRPGIWASGDDLELTIQRGFRGRTVYRLGGMKPAGLYIGEPTVEWLVNRLRTKKGGSKSVLLVGPSGVGKTTLGRLAAEELRPDGRTLKVTAKVLAEVTHEDLLDLVRYAAPAVLLLDDVQGLLGNEDEGPTEGYSALLSLMEALHGEDCVLVSTLMTDDERFTRRGGASSDYYPGMRPGRIDLVVHVRPPTRALRKKILETYLDPGVKLPPKGPKQADDILRQTSGLTGAYLKALAGRLNDYGTEGWRAEVKSLKASAPRVRMRERQRARSVRLTEEQQLARLARRAASLGAKLVVPSPVAMGGSLTGGRVVAVPDLPIPAAEAHRMATLVGVSPQEPAWRLAVKHNPDAARAVVALRQHLESEGLDPGQDLAWGLTMAGRAWNDPDGFKEEVRQILGQVRRPEPLRAVEAPESPEGPTVVREGGEAAE